MKINAYIMAADPAWIEASVLSYYDHVDRIVVSYDQNGIGFTGKPVQIEETLRRLRAIDCDDKFDYRPGHFARSDFYGQPLTNDTYQRQTALDQAGTDADWVIQLDTDEVVGDVDRFMECLRRAAAGNAEGLAYPARWLYRHVYDNVFLEQCRRFWRVAAGYPGPVAVRCGAKLTVARQGPANLYRVDFAKVNTDPSHPRDARVDEAVTLSQGIAHFSWARSEAELRTKSTTSGHSVDYDWKPLLQKWLESQAHPWQRAFFSQFEFGNLKRHLRLTKVDLPAQVSRGLPFGFNTQTGGLFQAAVNVEPAPCESLSSEPLAPEPVLRDPVLREPALRKPAHREAV